MRGYLISIASLFLMTGCPDRSQAPEALGKRTVVLGVDLAVAPSGVHEFLRTSFESKSDKRMEFVTASSYDLVQKARAGELDALLLATDAAFEMLQEMGAVEASRVVAHEEMVIIGPIEDQIRSHGATNAAEFMKNLGSFSALYFKARPGSAEELMHRAIMTVVRDREPGSYIQEKNEGLAHVERIVGHPRAFGMVLRSSLVMAASLGKKPQRVYMDGQADLVVRVRAIAVRPSLTKREAQPELASFLLSEDTEKAFAEVGRARYGLPLYGAGDVAPGQGAAAPGVVLAPPPTPPPAPPMPPPSGP